MTNSEMIQKLETDGVSSVSDMDFITNALEENDKLKAEVEQLKEDYSVLARQYNNVENSSIRYYNEVKQLKSEIEQWQSTNLKLVCELTRIECENNQLKAELEQSVKLPCKIGDTVYCVDFYNNTIDESTVNDITYYAEKEEFSFDSDLLYFWSEDIGKCVFLTKEEAEQSLKGQVEE